VASDQSSDESVRILLVEDSPADRLLVERLFRDRVTVAPDAEAALEAVRRQSFAAILLAQSLPRRSGLEVLRDLRAASDATPIVLMTECDDEDIRQAALDAGATACVVKQMGFERDLAAVIDRPAGDPSDAARGIESLAHQAHDILLFEIEGQRHGLFATEVETVSRAVTIASVPAAPAGLEGCIEYRGHLVPVIDLRARLGLARTPVDESEHLIVVRVDGRTLAVRADRAVALVRVEASRLEPTPELMRAGIGAVARLPDGPVFIDDLSTVLDGRDRPGASVSAHATGAGA
jgi:purine-binding chemotaxis protein CheW